MQPPIARTIIFEQAPWIHHCCNNIFILHGLAARWGKVKKKLNNTLALAAPDQRPLCQ